MKKFLAIALLSGLMACDAAHTSELSAQKRVQTVSDENGEEDLVAKYGYDKPLKIDLGKFRDVARAALIERFGKIADQGEIIHKDMLNDEASHFNDLNRLYYVVKVDIDSRVAGSEELYGTYMLSTQGFAALGYAKVNKFADGRDNIEWIYGSVAAIYKEILTGEVDEDGEPVQDHEAMKEILFAATANYEKEFDQLSFYASGLANAIFAEPLDLLQPTAEQVLQMSNFLKATESDKNVTYIELQAEYGKFFSGKVSKFGGGEDGQVIDLNALRDITIERIKLGQIPLEKLPPHLPAPFADSNI